MTDSELVNLVKHGDISAFDQLWARYKSKIEAYCYRLLDNKQNNEDIAMITFAKSYHNIAKLHDGTNFRAWVYTIARNECYNDNNKKFTRVKKLMVSLFDFIKPGSDITINDIIPDKKRTADQLIIDNERVNLIMEAVNTINEKHREILLLNTIDGLNYQEIADTIGCSINKVKISIHRARKKLKVFYENRLFDETT